MTKLQITGYSSCQHMVQYKPSKLQQQQIGGNSNGKKDRLVKNLNK